MPTRYVHPEEGWNQNQQRQLAIFFDQHRSERHPDGRAWWCYTENPADPKHPRHPVGEMIPVTADLTLPGESFVIPGWDAPWVPEPKYVTMAISTMQGNRFRFDYQRMVADYRQANLAYYTKAAQEAAARNWPGPQLFGPVSFQLRAVVGNPPKSPKVPEAAQAGDPWLLGFSATPNDALAAILAAERGQLAVTLIEAGVEEAAVVAAHRQERRAGALNVLGSLTDEEIETAIRAAERLKRERLRERKRDRRPVAAASAASAATPATERVP